MSYFNTTNESGATLKNNVTKAKSQEENLYNLINRYDCFIEFGITPSQAYNIQVNYPITSIRRALTNLTKQGKLIKTNEKRIGMYNVLRLYVCCDQK